MVWKFTGDKPVYQQIMALLRHAVLRGTFPPGSKIPPVRDLAREAQVNPNTMQRALSELEQEGLLTACGTIGRFVTDDPQVLQRLREAIIKDTMRDCARQLNTVGLTLEEAARLLPELEKEDV